jgi:ribulose-phosphate 3-epimerase
MDRNVIPTVFAIEKKKFKERLDSLRKISKFIQIDLMDGIFVKNKSIEIDEVPNLSNYRNKFEAHLMVKSPSIYIDKIKRKGFKKVIIHCESFKSKNELLETVEKIKKKKMKVFIALNPESTLEGIIQFLTIVDGVLFMGVNPGKEHQNFIDEVFVKIRELRKFKKKLDIQVDGGVNIKTAPKIKEAGANIINSGSFISDSDNPKKALNELESVFN